jgi:hypothetical protein
MNIAVFNGAYWCKIKKYYCPLASRLTGAILLLSF